MAILMRDVAPPVEPREPKHMVMEKPERPKLLSPSKLLRLHQWPAIVGVAGIESRGRAEWLMSLAAILAEAERSVYLADMTAKRSFLRDPATAVRIRRTMSGVHALAPDDEDDDGNPSILGPEIERHIKGRRGGRVLLDVGASALGLAALGGLKGSAGGCDVLLVLNPFNIRTADADNARALKLFVEGFSGLPVTGIVATPHRGQNDEPRLCAAGAMSALAIAQALNLPLLYVLADEEIAEKISALLPEELPVWPVLGLEDDKGGRGDEPNWDWEPQP